MRRHILVVLSLLLLANISISQDETDKNDKGIYKGYSDYRLAWVEQHEKKFNPNQDLTKPTPMEKKKNKLREEMVKATMKSLVPMMGILNGGTPGTQANLMNAILTMVSNLQKELSKALDNFTTEQPLFNNGLLIPWDEKREDLFYGRQKLSISPDELINVIGPNPLGQKFEDKLTERLLKLQKKLYKECRQPVFLLGTKKVLYVDKKQRHIIIDVLLGLKPFEKPFTKENPKVVFQKMVVPDIPSRGIVAHFKFFIDLSKKQRPPVMYARFGDLIGIQNGRITLNDEKRYRFAPRLEGHLKKQSLLRKVQTKFSFIKMKLDITKREVSELQTLISAGIKIRGANFGLGGIHLESVDKEFEKEINKTIDKEIKKAVSKGENAIFGGLMNTATMFSTFSKILEGGR